MRLTKAITIKLESLMLRTLRKLADERKMPLSQVVREALDVYCNALASRSKKG